jgi:hypothetical protein
VGPPVLTPPDAPPPPVEPESGVCPNCAAPHDPYQEYCLECGERLPRPYVVRRETWWRQSPAALWATLLALFLLAAAGVLLVLLLTHDDEKATKVVSSGPTTTPVGTFATGTTGTLPATITIGPATGSTSISIPSFTTTAGTTTTSTTTTTGAGLTAWPSGRSGYTIVLESDPTANGRTKPDATAQRAINAGLPQVGVLNSSDYSSLNPGYYVVFTGIYDSASGANSHLQAARDAGFPLAYTRRVAP